MFMQCGVQVRVKELLCMYICNYEPTQLTQGSQLKYLETFSRDRSDFNHYELFEIPLFFLRKTQKLKMTCLLQY